MSKRRILLVHAVIALLIAGSLYDIAMDRETWPFSQYPMYSGLHGSRLAQLQLFGVAQEEPHQEIPLNDPSYIEPASEYLQPFDRSRIRWAFDWILVKNEGAQRRQMFDNALLDCLKRYETLRLAGRHNRPPLQGIRLYQLQWRLDPQASNVDHPDNRTLIAEVEQP
jgi:hypothetical protein